MVQLTVLYPQPTDVKQFEADYVDHLLLLHEKTGIPPTEKPYTVTKFLSSPDGAPVFFQMFKMPFSSAESLMEAMATPAMQEVGADAARISTGGAPIVLVGTEE